MGQDVTRFKPGGIYLNVTVPLPSPRMLWKSRAAGVRMALSENPTAGPALLIAIRDLVEAGELRPVIDRSYPLNQIIEARRYVDRGHKRGNVVIRVAADDAKASVANRIRPTVGDQAA